MRRAFVLLSTLPVAILWACGGSGPMQTTTPSNPAASVAGATADPMALEQEHATFAVRNLVSDGNVPAEHTDTNLVNAWGLDALPTTPWWIADNGAGVSTLYDGEGIAQPLPPATPSPLVVQLPGASAPTGLVANPGDDFMITLAGVTGPARFLFASEDGVIDAWLRTTPLSDQAVTKIDATPMGAVFKGLAISTGSSLGSRLYATDFHNFLVRVYDGAFNEITQPGMFTDSKIPDGFSPFGIRVIRGFVLVTYAMKEADGDDDVPGPGLGYVDAYSLDGKLLARVASRGKLNSPWGLALAPAGFGRNSLRLLVGNFGDGHIVSFGLHREDGHGHDRGDQKDDMDDDGSYLRSSGEPIVIDGLWSLSFGNGSVAGPKSTLFFTAGPNKEADGLFGRIDFSPGKHDGMHD
jgi:uncharacterized protein (TIGR03118 family)